MSDALTRTSLAIAAARMQPGDVLAFAGEGLFSETISRFTDSPISHVGVVFGRNLFGELMIAESTSLDEHDGVSIGRLEDRVREYEGSVYWLPLNEQLGRQFGFREFQTFLLEQEGKRYDFRQVLQFAVRKLAPALAKRLPWYREDLGRVFCSELIARAFELAGILPARLNASAISPADLVSFQLYAPFYFQLKGTERAIPRFNTVSLFQLLKAAA